MLYTLLVMRAAFKRRQIEAVPNGCAVRGMQATFWVRLGRLIEHEEPWAGGWRLAADGAMLSTLRSFVCGHHHLVSTLCKEMGRQPAASFFTPPPTPPPRAAGLPASAVTSIWMVSSPFKPLCRGTFSQSSAEERPGLE